MTSKVKEKLVLVRKDEIKCLELITNFKKALNLWFICGTVNNIFFEEVLNSCVDIILHGLGNKPDKLQTRRNTDDLYNDSSPKTSSPLSQAKKIKNCDKNISELYKIIDHFEWVHNAVKIKPNSTNPSPKSTLSKWENTSMASPIQNNALLEPIKTSISQSSIALYVTQWLEHNLSEHNLCGFLQYLLNDKELLEEHYNQRSLLRQEKFVTMLVIGLTAFETHQYALLSQIDAILKDDIKEMKQHKRSNSQPNIIIVPESTLNHSNLKQRNPMTSISQYYSKSGLTSMRKTQSLNELLNNEINVQDVKDRDCLQKSKLKKIQKSTSLQNIPQSGDCKLNPRDSNANSLDSFMYNYDDNQPTTSQASSNRSKSPMSNYSLNSDKSATSSLISTPVSSINSNDTAKYIELINTDDIKIWTDHTWELKQKSKQRKQMELTSSCAIPTPKAPTAKPCKSQSPLNSFFSSLFSTPPSYTSWFTDHDSQNDHVTTETAIESIIPDNNFRNSISSSQPPSSSLSIGSTVFDKFLPTDGKKVRCRNSQHLFGDVNTTLNCSGVNMLVSANCTSAVLPSTSSLLNGSMPVTSKNCQSLTRYLQMSHLSRNNTDLEKENAHFRISEAIISAIEHMKWNKLETRKDTSCLEATALATDCLASSDPLQNTNVSTTSNDIVEGDHIPYAELEEASNDILSAEVVGLSLISKFDEKHLPKVSELKWLVSDDDTPQKLLPMPDLSSSANPDEHVIQSTMRGTRHWAPPRQQIIFTNHPPPNRKELLRKQNYRCAGCGMRVSTQYMQSFRYCTYLGKYHCTGCHRNQISATPAKILQAWDFKCYPVCVFSYRLLEQMYSYPLFYVPHLNPVLYKRCKSLLSARNKRLQLKYVKDFIRMCRFALSEQSYFESVPDYITADIDNWSMSDFVDARTKCLHRSIDKLINKCESHIFSCVLCTARGFLCEYCHVDVVIYPWGSRVERCDGCGTCFHRNCWKSVSGKCCRCQRIDKRHGEINDVI